MKKYITDKYGNEIYVTDERWQHIVGEHPEMMMSYEQLLKTIRTGKRKQDAKDPTKFRYTQKFKGLKRGNAILAIVKFGFKNNVPNNFVLTAVQIFIR